jgi:hypothetical protein
MRLHIVALSNSRQLHAIGLQAQALQSMLSQLSRFEHGGPRESLPLASHVSPVLSVVYATKTEEIPSAIMIPLAIACLSRVASDNEARRGAANFIHPHSDVNHYPLRSMAAARVHGWRRSLFALF